MIFGGQTNRFHRKMFESQQQFAAIGQQEFHILAREIDRNIRILDFRMRIFGRAQLIRERQARVSEQRVQKLIEPGPQ